jgi:cytoskeletal protein CcmA (bactofilin family)
MDGREAVTMLPKPPGVPRLVKEHGRALVPRLLYPLGHIAGFVLGGIMWGNRKGKAHRMRGGLGAFLDEGSEIDGKYTCTGTVMLDAKLRGEIISRDTLIIGEHGMVEATVEAATVVVCGRVVGNVMATERVELKCTARVTGDVEAPVIVMEPGAVLDGRCRMTKEKPAEAPLSLVIPRKG